ncbi:LysB family phage lysis regulatory protein [Paraburkholderia eburnea]|uniref:LysB family phage lysis regulatory protein n=1 Tax=Paraburkholderia eburnea TaxID=1189126 RepID=A0A2S4LWB0_9BURK|nr:Rz-like lysis system protein LysB [Paraburkholderia eburnea]POR46742.1 LysB family phage lysis regulatory protein [Paraburkholderia eburnea]PRZ17931.1 LysB family phage lysis regulatory protein [Paraburkholderia eburnea]
MNANSIAAKLIAGALGLALLVGAVLYVRTLRAELADANHQLADANAAIASRDQTINGLRQNQKNKADQQKQLDTSTGTVATKLASARQEIRKVINENPIVRSWADTPLPDDVVRLSNTPAATGADAYRAGVSNDIALHAAGNGADD